VALAAPAIAGQFDASLARITGALRQAGFTAVLEVASGADAVAAQEARELAGRLEAGEPYMTSSCCPAFTGFLSAKVPAMKARVSTTPTPLTLAAREAASRFPGLRRVFLSPCVAKRREVLEGGLVDHVLTLEEVGALLEARGIVPATACPMAPDQAGGARGRGFAAAGGVGTAVLDHFPAGKAPSSEHLAGLGKANQRALQAYGTGKGPARFLEGMGCDGGCLAGPCTLADPKLAKRRLERAAAEEVKQAG